MEIKKEMLEEKLFTIYEAAEVLRVHWQTVRNMIIRKDINAFKVGQQWRISNAEMERIKSGESNEHCE